MDASLRDRLGAALGRESIDSSGTVVSPADADQVAVACRTCAESGTPITISSSAPAASTAAGAGVLLSVHRLSGIAVDRGSLTARAAAGASVSALRSAVDAAGLALAVRVATAAQSESVAVGALIGRGDLARRGLTGIEIVLAGGERVHAGGAMPKDVAGYDLAGALLGSRGRLGVVVAATFRLIPAGATASDHEPPGPSGAGGAGELVRAAFDPQGLLAGAR